MNDLEVSIENRRSKVGWLAGIALAVAAAVGLFLYADGYFDPTNSAEVEVDTPAVIIEGN